MGMNGREIIKTRHKVITRENVVSVLNDALVVHNRNATDIRFLYRYVKGIQPIVQREKPVRPEICNKIIVNRAAEITEFKTSYLLGEPCQYISRTKQTDDIAQLNDYMATRGKASIDVELAFWFHVCGTAYRMILPTPSDDAPFDMFALDPVQTFVVYWSGISNKPVMGVYIVDVDDYTTRYSVYTEDTYFEVENGKVIGEEPHKLGGVPIIEYAANDTRMGCFEPVVTLLDAINTVESNRIDGVEQFVQSFIKFVNCNIDDTQFDEFRKKGAIKIKSDSQNPADVDVMSSELNQTQVQTLIDNLYNEVLTIVGMPSQSDGNGSDSSNNGAVILRNGWHSAEARAKQAELKFKKSEKLSLRIILKICSDLGLANLRLSDIDMAFTRRNYTDIATKSQVLISMLGNDKIHPLDAYAACGMFSDSNAACERGMEYHEQMLKEKGVRENTVNKSQAETTVQTENETSGKTIIAGGTDNGKT